MRTVFPACLQDALSTCSWWEQFSKVYNLIKGSQVAETFSTGAANQQGGFSLLPISILCFPEYLILCFWDVLSSRNPPSSLRKWWSLWHSFCSTSWTKSFSSRCQQPGLWHFAVLVNCLKWVWIVRHQKQLSFFSNFYFRACQIVPNTRSYDALSIHPVLETWVL